MRRILLAAVLLALASGEVIDRSGAGAGTSHRDSRRTPARSRRRPHPDEPDDPRSGHAHPRGRPERRDSAGRAGHRSVDDDGDAGPRRRAQPSGAHLQADPREQRLLLHLRAGIDGAARDSGGVERHPDARVRLHDRPRHGQQRQLRGHGAAAGDRAGLDPGPTIINSGIIIGGMGGQFFPTPEMAKDHNIVYPEYLDADTPDEIVKAIRQNVLFGARVIKICVDCKPYGYTADEIRLIIREAAKSGMKVEGHVQTLERRPQRDRRRHLVDRAFDRAERRDAQADGAERHLARRHRDAAGTRGPSRQRRRPTSAPSTA